MTTIKLIPQVMEFDVSLDSASMPSLFSQSMETTIIEQVERQVNGRIPTHDTVVESVANTMMESRDYTRKVRNWVLESIDYSQIASEVRDNIDYAELIDLTAPLWDNEAFLRHLLSNNRFRNMVNNQVQVNIGETVSASFVRELVNEKVESLTANLSNEIAEKVLKVIQNRLTAGSDV
jgi:preprotein translocase subunit SecA